MTDRPEEIEKRLAAIEEIGDVVGALRVIAAGRAAAAQGALAAISAYESQIRAALARLAAPPATPPVEGAGMVIVIGAAQGFSGAYPQRLAQTTLEKAPARAGYLIVGARTQAMLAGAGLDTLLAADLPPTPADVPALASRITDILVHRAERYPGPILAVSGRDLPGQPVELRRIWPPETEGPEAPPASGPAPVTSLPPEVLVAGLLEETLFSEVARALIEGLRVENLARVEAMARSAGNLKTRRTEMEHRFRQARQEQMTTELLELSTARSGD